MADFQYFGAYYDLETNGLLEVGKDGHPPMDRQHTNVILFFDERLEVIRKISAADDPSWLVGPEQGGWERMALQAAAHELGKAKIRVGHNIQDFDERSWALSKNVNFTPPPGSDIIDTLLWSRLLYPDIMKSGPNNWKLPGFLRALHSLKAWGLRLGMPKDEYTGGWMQWSEEMQLYGQQDGVSGFGLFKWLWAQKPSLTASVIEHGFAGIIRRQERRGVCFDYPKALILEGALTTREQELEENLIEAFGEWWEWGKPANAAAGRRSSTDIFYDCEEDEDFEDEEEQERRRREWAAKVETGDVVIPSASRNVKMLGHPDIIRQRFSASTGKEIKPYVGPPLISYTEGHPYTPIKRVQFKPSSRTHIRKRFKAKYGWEPSKFTKGGKNSPPQPIVDDAVLMGLPFPEAKLLAEYYLVLKRIGMLSTGKNSWLKLAVQQPDGSYRIHGRINTCGALGGRCTHSKPNLAQVPKNSSSVKEYPDQWYLHGSSCRDLFIATKGYALVGWDGSSLELRMLGHYMSPFDGGAYSRAVDEGRKEDQTDPHSLMCLAVGEDLLGPVAGQGRDNAKTVVYADLYGAGNEKRGAIVQPAASKAEKIRIGQEIQARQAEAFPALAKLKTAIEETVEEQRYLIGLDGRTLRIRKAHAALNTLLQSAGAVCMKQALILVDQALQREGWEPGREYEFVLNVHDEVQAEVLPVHVPRYQELARAAVTEAGRRLRLKCPLKAEAQSGQSWKATH